MIGKLKKGSSFGGCVRYVTGKDEAKILASDGVLLGTNAEITQSFELQRQLNPRIKKPVGHIALSFKILGFSCLCSLKLCAISAFVPSNTPSEAMIFASSLPVT